MKQLLNLQVFMYNLKLMGKATLIVAAVFGFVFISYLDLTRGESKPKANIEITEVSV